MSQEGSRPIRTCTLSTQTRSWTWSTFSHSEGRARTLRPSNNCWFRGYKNDCRQKQQINSDHACHINLTWCFVPGHAQITQYMEVTLRVAVCMHAGSPGRLGRFSWAISAPPPRLAIRSGQAQVSRLVSIQSGVARQVSRWAGQFVQGGLVGKPRRRRRHRLDNDCLFHNVSHAQKRATTKQLARPHPQSEPDSSKNTFSESTRNRWDGKGIRTLEGTRAHNNIVATQPGSVDIH